MNTIDAETKTTRENARVSARRGKNMSSTTLPYLVVGLGASGVSCVQYLKAQGQTVKVVDTRLAPPGLEQVSQRWPDVEIKLGAFDVDDFIHCREILISPGVPLAMPAVQQAIAQGVPCYGDVELFVREAKAPIFAVTGSNGKSTTVTLLTELLREQGLHVELGGNIGVPVLDLLKKPVPDYYVLELSSFQLETTSSLKAHAAVVLNVSADHMDRYASLEDYRNSKTKIFADANWAIVNVDDTAIAEASQQSKQRVTYSLHSKAVDVGLAQIKQQTWIKLKNELIIDVSELKIPGRHNVENVLAVLALASTAGLTKAAMIATLRRFTGLDHRTQWVLEQDQIRWYNDSKGTNIGATVAAIDGLGCPVVLIAGGQGKGADFNELSPSVCRHARAVVLIGEDAPLIEQALGGCVPVAHAQSMDEAVLKARGYAQAGDAVLLSPACASFDMFKNFVDRGDTFVESVKRLIEQ